ncbi:MAG: DUF2726 domain-containing protein [Sulfuriferula sp.]
MGAFVMLAVVILIVFAVLAAMKKAKPAGGSEAWPFYQRKPLSTPEQILYFRLVKALPDHIILGQVQLSRLLGVKKGNNAQAWLNRMSADFVVCNKDSSIVAVIELDDATHNGEKRQQADAKKDKALAAASITIHRWQAKAIPDDTQIKATFLSKPIASVATAA